MKKVLLGFFLFLFSFGGDASEEVDRKNEVARSLSVLDLFADESGLSSSPRSQSIELGYDGDKSEGGTSLMQEAAEEVIELYQDIIKKQLARQRAPFEEKWVHFSLEEGKILYVRSFDSSLSTEECEDETCRYIARIEQLDPKGICLLLKNERKSESVRLADQIENLRKIANDLAEINLKRLNAFFPMQWFRRES